MNFCLPAIALIALLIVGCTSLKPPAVSLSPLPKVSISPPPYSYLVSSTPKCPNRLCGAKIGSPVLVFTENRINRSTYGKRGLPFNIPECAVVETAFDQSSLRLEKLEVDSPDYMNYYLLYYFVPFRRGTYNVRIKTACEVRGTVFSIDAR